MLWRCFFSVRQDGNLANGKSIVFDVCAQMVCPFAFVWKKRKLSNGRLKNPSVHTSTQKNRPLRGVMIMICTTFFSLRGTTGLEAVLHAPGWPPKAWCMRIQLCGVRSCLLCTLYVRTSISSP